MELAVGEFWGGEEKENPNSESKLNPLEMDNVVENILINLDFESLRVVRQVSRLWNSEGIKILFKKHFIRVPRALYSRENRQNKKYKKLRQQFKNFLSYNSFKIPHLSIHFKSDAAVLKVLAEKGELKEVKSLRWPERSSKEKEAEKVLKEILYQLPNLNYLDPAKNINAECVKVIMDFCLATKSENQNEPKSKFLVVLSRFHMNWEGYDDLEVLRVQSLMADFESFSKCEGVLIQNFEVEVSWFYDLESHPLLQNRLIKLITAFIWRNRGNLIELKVRDRQQLILPLDLPEMPKLEKLDLSFGERLHGVPEDPHEAEERLIQPFQGLNIPCDALPQSFKFAKMTPNLKEFHLSWLGSLWQDEMRDHGYNFWSTVFESAGYAPSVQKLAYSDSSKRGYNIDNLLQMFPNLQDFEACSIPNFESALTSVWKFGKNLSRLTLTVSHVHFDWIFTGFAQETVDKMIKSKSKSKDGKSEFEFISSADVESLRVNPSILDLKGLKSVKMTFGFCHYNLNLHDPEETLSVAGEFAFKLMPKTDFHIRINSRAPKVVRTAAEKLSQLPNVTFSEFDYP